MSKAAKKIKFLPEATMQAGNRREAPATFANDLILAGEADFNL
jgi:hypothetical protein